MFAAPFDPTRWAHAAHLVIGIVPWVFEAARKLANRRLPMLRWRCLRKRLVRALLVIVLAEGVEARLLFFDSRRRRARRLGLKCDAALVTAVVLRA